MVFYKCLFKIEIVAQVPLDDILSIIITGRGATHTSSLFSRLATNKIPFIICDKNYKPIAWVLGIEGNSFQCGRMLSQIAAKKPLVKNAWRDIIVSKILNQATVLDLCNNNGDVLRALSKKVRSGDTSNVEAQAAMYYWRKLFDKNFQRDNALDGINAMLNYGYAIIRSCVARSIVASGLHPTIGLHHRNPTNSLCLVDDLMEPFRPIVDLSVYSLVKEGLIEVNTIVKRRLADLSASDTESEIGTSPLFTATNRLSISLAKLFEGTINKIELPDYYEPLTMMSIMPKN